MIGTAVNAGADSIIAVVDPLISKLYEDKNIVLDGGGTISVSFSSPNLTLAFALNGSSQNLKLVINSKLVGGTPVTKTISGTSFNFGADGRMLYIILDNRTTDSTLSGTNVVADAATLPSVVFANQEVFLIAKRVDENGTQRIYFRNGFVLQNGQTGTMGSAAGQSSFSDSVFQIFDNIDNSKVARFENTLLSTATTNIFSFPNITQNSNADTLAVLNTDQVFSGGWFSANTSIRSTIVPAGQSFFRPQLVIPVGQTYTVGILGDDHGATTGAFFYVVDRLTINGTLTVFGTSRVI